MKAKLLILFLLLSLGVKAQFIVPDNTRERVNYYTIYDSDLGTLPHTSDLSLPSGWIGYYRDNGIDYYKRYAGQTTHQPVGDTVIYYIPKDATINRLYFGNMEMDKLEINNELLNFSYWNYSQIDTVIFNKKIKNTGSWSQVSGALSGVKYLEFKDSIYLHGTSIGYFYLYNNGSVHQTFIKGLDKIQHLGSSYTGAYSALYFGAGDTVGTTADFTGLKSLDFVTQEYINMSGMLFDTLLIPNVATNPDLNCGVYLYGNTALDLLDFGTSKLGLINLNTIGKTDEPFKIKDTDFTLRRFQCSNSFIDTIDFSTKDVKEMYLSASQAATRDYWKEVKISPTTDYFYLSWNKSLPIDLSPMPNDAYIYFRYVEADITFPDTADYLDMSYCGTYVFDLDSCISNRYQFNNIYALMPDSVPKMYLYANASNLDKIPKCDSLRNLYVYLSGATPYEKWSIGDYEHIDIEASIGMSVDTLDLSGINKFSTISTYDRENISIYSLDTILLPVNDTVWTPVGISATSGSSIKHLDLSKFMYLKTASISSASTTIEKITLPDSTMHPDGLSIRILRQGLDSLLPKQNRISSFSFYQIREYANTDSMYWEYPDTTISGGLCTTFEFDACYMDSIDIKGYSAVTYCNFRNTDSLKYLRLDHRISPTQFRLSYATFGYLDFIQGATSLTSVHSQYLYMDAMELTAAEVNHYLYDLDQISVAGFNNRRIYLNGTGNAAPDASSGGYDGTAAVSSLVTKGFTVYTN